MFSRSLAVTQSFSNLSSNATTSEEEMIKDLSNLPILLKSRSTIFWVRTSISSSTSSTLSKMDIFLDGLVIKGS
ncbi:hypothetical protein WICPIJ_005923 [Wickerhamomyces pijperi]|uniref:Uncharacterized protein n=1 Tax=Wickerhamomyces pijperi TaxID=599730 RepID=A0A9P8Q2L8_WICPI|nr:hypothetical protein WICPIJ_005923 [Wickerhamomyces pijperi]